MIKRPESATILREGTCMTRHRCQPWARPALLVASMVLSACASFSPDGGFASVQQAARERLGKDVQWTRDPSQVGATDDTVRALLAKPLSVDDAVQVALLQHRGLQASFQMLGIAEADVVQASRLPNPGFTFGRSAKGDEREIERSVHLNLARLLLMPMVQKMEARRFAAVQGQAVMTMLEHASDTRKAYIHALAAEEGVRYMRQVQEAAEASAELARRMQQVGNFNKLQRAREQAFYADATLRLAQAMQLQRSTRERLTRLMGLWGAQTQFTLPSRLPNLPDAPVDQPELESKALAQRLDVQGARMDAEHTAQQLGLTRTSRFINVLELEGQRNSSNEGPTQRGWELSLELPLFDWGGARVARAEAIYMQSLHRAAQVAIDARSEVREAYAGYRSAYDIARHHRNELVPLSQRISEENLLRYNGMFIGVFELLADARSQIATVSASIEALRDFWLAQADLDMALIGKPKLSMPAAPSMASGNADAGH